MKHTYMRGHRLITFIFVLSLFLHGKCRNQQIPSSTVDQEQEDTDNVEMLDGQGQEEFEDNVGMLDEQGQGEFEDNVEMMDEQGQFEDMEDERGGMEQEKEKEQGNPQQLRQETEEANKLRTSAIMGNREAQFELGKRAYEAYQRQGNVEAADKAKLWLKKAADQGHEGAQALLQAMDNDKKRKRKDKDKNEKERERKKIAKEKKEEEMDPINLGDMPAEIVTNILKYLDPSNMLQARAVNTVFYKLITGQNPPTKREKENIGLDFSKVGNKPKFLTDDQKDPLADEVNFINFDDLEYKKLAPINFDDPKYKGLTPENFPNFFFYRLIVKVRNLPEKFWPYLKDSNIRMIDMSDYFTRKKVVEFEDILTFLISLKGTNVVGVDLGGNQLGNKLIDPEYTQRFAEALQGTNVRWINLGRNSINSNGILQLAEALNKARLEKLKRVYLRNQAVDPKVKKQIIIKYGLNIQWIFK